MVEITMKHPISLRIDQPLFDKLNLHLFPGDHDEHGAIIVAGICETPRGTRLLARDVILAKDGVDYVPGTRGYRALTAKFVAEVSHTCSTQNLCYLAVHCHGGQDRVAFSADDLASHKLGYPALLDITHGGPVGGLVFAKNAVAGDIWIPSGQFDLDHMVIIGPQIRRLYPSPRPRPRATDPMYDRHARMFGDVGQAILANLKVGIIGLGGGGSLINEWLAHLGVGHIVAVDFDRMDLTNRPRIVGSNPWDAMEWLTRSSVPWLKALGQRLSSRKVDVARRVAKRANPSIHYDAIASSITEEAVAKQLTDADFIFLAADTAQSRLVFNLLVHQYLIPGIQIGAKVSVNPKTERVGDIFTVTRPVLPFAGGGCLDCHQLISPSRLQEEALNPQERKAQRYVESDETPQPSVITLNVKAAAQAINDFLMMFTGLYDPKLTLQHQMEFVKERQTTGVEPLIQENCLHCSNHAQSHRGKGDRASLPCC
jgi:hypothetical protein